MSEIGSSAVALPAHVPLAPIGKRVLRIAVLLSLVVIYPRLMQLLGVDAS